MYIYGKGWCRTLGQRVNVPEKVLLFSTDEGKTGFPRLDMEARDFSRVRLHMYMYDGNGHTACDTAPNYKERMMPFLTKGLQTD